MLNRGRGSVRPLVENMKNCHHKSFKTWALAYEYYVQNWNARGVKRIPIPGGPYDNAAEHSVGNSWAEDDDEGVDDLTASMSGMRA